MVREIWPACFCLAFAVSACGSSDKDDKSGNNTGGSGGGTSSASGTNGAAGSPGSCDDAFAVVAEPYTPNTSIEEWGGFAVDEDGAVFSVIPDSTLTDDIDPYNNKILASDLDGNVSTLHTDTTGTAFYGKMLLHDDDVYMLAGLLVPSIARMPRSGGEPVEIAEEIFAGPVLRDDFIYYATGGVSDAGIYQLDPDTDESTLLVAREDEIVTLDVDGDTLYWLESDGFLEETDYRLFSMPVDGDTPEMLQSLPRAELALGSFRVIDGVLFGSELTEDFDVIVTRTPIGEASETVEDNGGLPMVIDGGFVYYGSGSGGITKAPLSFDSKTTVPGTAGRSIYSIAVGPDDLWYSEVSCIFRTDK